MTDLAARLSNLPTRRGVGAWPGHEHVRGWGVMGLPLESGHYLALRVFPDNDFAPYMTVWHRDPDLRWSIYVDGPRLDTACPRYYGPACHHVGHSEIEVTWTGPMSLRISADAPRLHWTLTATSTPLLRSLNAVGAALPSWTWRPSALLRAREVLAQRLLGMGDLRMRGTMPSGHTGTLMPDEMYFVEEASAALDGLSLGRPAHVVPTPDIGGFPLPARGVLAIGGAAWPILDRAEYEQARAATASGRES